MPFSEVMIESQSHAIGSVIRWSGEPKTSKVEPVTNVKVVWQRGLAQQRSSHGIERGEPADAKEIYFALHVIGSQVTESSLPRSLRQHDRIGHGRRRLPPVIKRNKKECLVFAVVDLGNKDWPAKSEAQGIDVA